MKTYSILLLLLIIIVGCVGKKKTTEEVVYSETAYIVKKNEFFETILARLLANSSLNSSIIKVLQKGGFPFGKCFPGDSINIVEKNNEFLKLTYYQNPTQIYYVQYENGYLCLAMKLPYIEFVACLYRGKIKSTLYESILEIGENPYLAFRFADIFAWEVDFVTETQNGDSFYVYVEKKLCDSVFVDYNQVFFARYKGQIGDFYGLYYVDGEGHEDYYNLKGESLRKSLLKSPLRFSYISSYFSKRRYHPILRIWRPHHGLDYVAPVGTPVSSIGDGIVVFKGWKSGYGNLVELKHKNGITTRYGHLSKFIKGLRINERVKMGELIGYVGTTGLSTGPHLHFEMNRNGVPINPLKANIPRAASVKKKYFDLFAEYRDSLLNIVKDMSANRGELLSGNTTQ